ncbi:MAG: 4Fe-4S binding protein [Candidatus Adiutrix sp.]|jgi:2-oxoacid:acceptor oxidoreductase delta subunit (pyruvate/2-ketoisovalerate family)|nr:4Fe-4S binding protein [Candidatus Adiutrix sp.]
MSVIIKPKLHTESFAYPEGTYFPAGWLTQKNAGWRSVRPVLSPEKCIGCLQCCLHCPDGTIRPEGDAIAFDYDFCKGCGICAKSCKPGAISMTDEKAAGA